MMEYGFEWTLAHGKPLNAPGKYSLPSQEACCGLKMSRTGMLTCSTTCWGPVLPEDISNSTDLSLVTSLVDRAKLGEST